MLFAKIAQLTCIGLAAAGVYSFVSAARDGETRRACTPLCAMHPDYAARNRLARTSSCPKSAAATARLAAYRGKTVILNFWTKSCRPCLEEMPSLASLAKALAPHPDIVLLTVSTDESVDDAHETMNSVLGGAEPPFIVMVDPESKVVREKFGTKLYPETWFIDPSGVIRARIDGGREWNPALTIDLAHSFGDPLQCGVQYREHKAEGPFAGLCGELASPPPSQ